ncbi:uncharacterized protein LOC126372637 [Pectinophora gossypiella]|uniref:uncharacterized protein LOC126372637 n=1 Tax=Pectinophora gossypiella TaxID=13191 RepID=UPI00214F06D7|nr:uncharacterized protein LOC126372637 [Pectinophora gossypiella]
MYKPIVVLCVVLCVIEALPSWQFLPPRDGYIPVYIRPGDTPLIEINPDLAEAFHDLPAGRSAGKHLEASPDTPETPAPEKDAPEAPEQADQPQPDPDTPEDTSIDRRPYEKKVLEKKTKKPTEVTKPVERR